MRIQQHGRQEQYGLKIAGDGGQDIFIMLMGHWDFFDIDISSSVFISAAVGGSFDIMFAGGAS